MLLDQLRDFEWLNEPKEVNFHDGGMSILALNHTDFWQNKSRNVHKDDGHFFFARKAGNFSLTVKWCFAPLKNFQQCGIMLRFNEQNWMKASLMFDNFEHPKLGSCVCNNGLTDWALMPAPKELTELWLRVKRQNGDYVLFVSLDGSVFQQIRVFNFLNEDVEIKAGAYLCAPNSEDFEPVLAKLDFD